MSLGVTQMRLSAPSPSNSSLFTRSSDFPSVCVCVCLSVKKTPSPPFLVRHTSSRCICVRDKCLFSHRLTYVWRCRCKPEEQQSFPLSEVRLLLHRHKQGKDAQTGRAYSLGLQCNRCNGQCKQEKVREEVSWDKQD